MMLLIQVRGQVRVSGTNYEPNVTENYFKKSREVIRWRSDIPHDVFRHAPGVHADIESYWCLDRWRVDAEFNFDAFKGTNAKT